MNNRFSQGAIIRDMKLRQVLMDFNVISGGNLGVDYDIRPTEPALVVGCHPG